MKMQNELKAPCAGTVTRINVAQGDSVEKNEIMVSLG
jgi:biotin carboxyl carrier protein